MIPDNCNNFNVKDEYKPLTPQQVLERQAQESLPFAVAALNVDSSLNIGVMIRTAALFGCERFFIFGRRKYDKRSTTGSENYIRVDRFLYNLQENELTNDKFLNHIFPFEPVFIETGGTNLNNFNFSKTKKKPCLVFGSEHFSIPSYLQELGPVLTIQQRGVLRCLNVASAASIAIFKCHEDLMRTT